MAQANLICAKSGLVFTCQFMPVSLGAGEIVHPFFNVSTRTLLAQASRWANGRMSAEETYLYYLALFDSSDLIVWRHAARFTPETMAIIESSMENLIKVIGKLEIYERHAKDLPHFTIDYDTSDLANMPYWITAWDDAIEESKSNYRTIDEIYEEQAREQTLERLIRSPFRNSDSSLARKLAEWAASAGRFPSFLTPAPNGKNIPCSMLWKEIIRACVDDDRVANIPRNDLEELINHVIDNIPQGTIFAAKLLEFLRAAQNKKLDMESLGLENADLAGQKTSFQIIHTQGQKTHAVLNAIASTAPSREPQRKDFPNLVSFVRAKSAWTLAQSMPAPKPALSLTEQINEMFTEDNLPELEADLPEGFSSFDPDSEI